VNEPGRSKYGVVVAIVAIPVAIACCAAPVFMLGLVSAAVGLLSGINSIIVIGFGVVIGALAFSLYQRSKVSR
tara:strand:+ start:1036 stop:1254 length:219 start_codon:yes stop_codon:yes gene_type:complete